jgi:hypothetical protein
VPTGAGYAALPNALLSAVGPARLRLSQAVTKVSYNAAVGGVSVTAANGTVVNAKFAVVSLPLGVLKAKAGTLFSPALPSAKLTAVARLGMGVMNKVILSFPVAFWGTKLGWIQRVPAAGDTSGRWLEFYSLVPSAGLKVLVAFNVGPPAVALEAMTDAAIKAEVLAVLRAMYPLAAVPEPSDVVITRWAADPFALGSYSYVAAGCLGRERTTLAAPVGKALFFAGEATRNDYPSLVQGAFLSGASAASAAIRAHPRTAASQSGVAGDDNNGSSGGGGATSALGAVAPVVAVLGGQVIMALLLIKLVRRHFAHRSNAATVEPATCGDSNPQAPLPAVVVDVDDNVYDYEQSHEATTSGQIAVEMAMDNQPASHLTCL